mgnify:CR=1 FL=1
MELADQYLDFIKMNINRLNLSADYLVMASLLAYLKSKMLLQVHDELIFEIPDDEIKEVPKNIASIMEKAYNS